MKDRDLRDLFEQALEAGRNRDYPRAIQLLNEILVKSDRMPEALLYLGRAYHASGDFNRAVRVLQFYIKVEPDSAEGHFFIGRAYFALGLLDHALSHLRVSIQYNDSFTPALGLLGLTLLKQGRSKTAVDVFEKALHLDPDNSNLFTGYLNALLTYAVRLFYRQQYEEAKDTLLFIRKHRPDSLVAHLYLASIFRELGDSGLSLYHFEKASHLAPKDPVLYLQKAVIHLQQGNNPSAYEEMSRAMDLLGKDSVSVKDIQSLLRLMTVVLFQNRKYRQAIECARRVLRRSYHDADMHAIMAECFRELGELRKAKNHYLRALERRREKLEYNYGLVAVLWERREYAELGQLLGRILKINPDDEIALYYRALCLPFLDNNYEKTIPVLQDQIRQSGPDPNLMQVLGQEYLKADLPELAKGWFQRTLGRIEDHEQALLRLIEVYEILDKKTELGRTYSRYLKSYPEDLESRKRYALLLYEQGSFAKASLELEIILPHEPKNASFRLMLAHSYRESQKYTEAILLYRELLLENPKAIDLVRPLVTCLEENGGQETAIAVLEKAVKLFKKDCWLQFRLATLYTEKREFEKAAKVFRNLISLDPEHWQAHDSLGRIYNRMGNNQFAERFLKRARKLKEAAAGAKDKKND